MHFFVLFSLLTIKSICLGFPPQVALKSNTSSNYTWELTFDLESEDAFYADYFDVSVDHPHIKINSWKVDQPSQEMYDTTFKQTKKIINTPVTISIDTTIEQFPSDAHFHVAYHRRSHHTIAREMLAITNPLPTHAKTILEPAQYSLLKKQPDFYTPSPIALLIALVLTLMLAYYYLKRSRSLYSIVLIALSVFLSFQFLKAVVIHQKIKHNWNYTLHSQRNPETSIFNRKRFT